MSASHPVQVMPQKPLGGLIRPTTCVQIGILALLMLAVYGGTIRSQMVAKWLHDANWSHGWLIPIFSLYFLFTQRERLVRCRPKPNYLGAVILTLSLAMYFISGWMLRMAYPQAVSIVGAIFGVTLLMGGWSIIRVVWFPIGFLMFGIPLPEALYVQLTFPLRELASTVAATVMPWFAPGLYTEAQAVVIDYVMPGRPPGQLNIEEACSGMRLMMAFVTLGVAMAYLRDRPAWQRIIMVLSCVPIAVFCNSIRVTTTGLLHVYGQQQLATGTAHQLLGILMLLVALGLYALIGYVLNHLFIEEAEDAPTTAASA